MSRKKILKKRRNWKLGVGAGCLALGMATAWSGEARGSTFLNISASTNQTINDAFVFYGIGYSSYSLLSLGILPAGQTTLSLELDGPPEDYRSPYAVIGLYDEGGSPGVAISFPNDDPITTPLQWADIFQTGDSYYQRTEPQVIDLVNQASAGEPWWLRSVLTGYAGWSGAPCAVEFGNEATMVLFSNPAPGGTVTIDLGTEPLQSVPEPATWVLLVGMTGALLFWRRDLIRC